MFPEVTQNSQPQWKLVGSTSLLQISSQLQVIPTNAFTNDGMLSRMGVLPSMSLMLRETRFGTEMRMRGCPGADALIWQVIKLRYFKESDEIFLADVISQYSNTRCSKDEQLEKSMKLLLQRSRKTSSSLVRCRETRS